MPGVERSFEGFSAAGDENTLIRILAGVHFRSDVTVDSNSAAKWLTH